MGDADNGNLVLTTIPWQNVEETELAPEYGRGIRVGTGKWSKKPSVYGSFLGYAYGSQTRVDTPGVEVIGYPKSMPVEAVQVGVICSPNSGLVVIDVDDPEAYAESDLGDLLPLELAYTRRGRGGHIYLDYRHVPREKWPTQGPIQGGDIKSAGFVAAAGSLHYSGDTYERADGDVLVVTEEEVEALLEAKRQAVGSSRPGAYQGDGHGDDDLMARSTYKWVFSGLEEGDIQELWGELADEVQDNSWPFTEKDFQRHLRGAVAKYEQHLADEQARLSAEEEAEQRIRDRVLAGQKDFPHLTEEPEVGLDVHERKIALTCENERAQKRKAEQHRHRFSRDWIRAPQGALDLFNWITKRETVNRKDVPRSLDRDGRLLAWLLKSKYRLHECANGDLLVMPDWNDPRWDPEYDEAEHIVGGTDTRKYPKWTSEDSPHPKAGRTWGPLMKQHVKRYIVEQHRLGNSPSHKQVAAYLNEFCRPDGVRFASIDAVRKAVDELEESGELVLLKKADRWRQGHGWINVAAVYCHPDEVPEGMTPIRPMPKLASIVDRVKARQEREAAPCAA